MNFIVIVFSIAVLALPAWAVPKGSSKNMAKLNSPTPEATSQFSLGIVYMTSQDLAEQTSPKRTRNSLSTDFGYALNDQFSLSASFSVTYVTLNGKTQEQATGGYGKAAMDYDFGAAYRLSVFKTNELKLSGGLSIPTDEISRFEGIKGIVYTKAGLNTPLYKKNWSLDNSASYNYILNRYDTSVSGESNAESSFAYTGGTRWRFNGGISIGVGVGVKTTRYLDNFVGYAYNNTQSIAYKYKYFTTSLSHTNGGFVDQGELNLWYVDRYRRLVSWKVGYDF